MIVRERPTGWDILFAVHGSIMPRIVWKIVGLAAFSMLVLLFDRYAIGLRHPNTAAFGAFGVALSLFLGFRNNAAYARWWEARILMGTLLADLRAFARETDIFVRDRALRHQILDMATAFIHLHRLDLRRIPPDDAALATLGGRTDVLDTVRPPCAMLDRVTDLIATAHRNGQIDGFGAKALTERMGAIGLHQAGCERIANTPLPFAYSLLIYRTTYLYCLLIPLSLIEASGWMTPLFTATVAYVFFGLAEVTEELVHPFGQTKNALPLDAICRAVEISMAPHLNRPVPEPLSPKDYFLS